MRKINEATISTDGHLKSISVMDIIWSSAMSMYGVLNKYIDSLSEQHHREWIKTKCFVSRIGTIYEDVTTDVLGSIGIWQWLVVVTSTALGTPSMFNQYEDMFLLKPSIEVTCIPPERFEVLNASLCTVTSINNATEQRKCNKWHVKLFWLIWLKKSVRVYVTTPI